jgi:hypothetical protein
MTPEALNNAVAMAEGFLKAADPKSAPKTGPKPFIIHGDRADFPQHAHELACALAHEMGVDLCDPDSGIDDPEADSGMLRHLRIVHDEAVRHGAECEGYEPPEKG